VVISWRNHRSLRYFERFVRGNHKRDDQKPHWGMRQICKLSGEFIEKLASLDFNRSPNLSMDVEPLERFCKDASQAFFNEFSLISHQINSFNQLIA